MPRRKLWEGRPKGLHGRATGVVDARRRCSADEYNIVGFLLCRAGGAFIAPIYFFTSASVPLFYHLWSCGYLWSHRPPPYWSIFRQGDRIE